MLLCNDPGSPLRCVEQWVLMNQFSLSVICQKKKHQFLKFKEETKHIITYNLR